ncbi:MAG: hypothetical protein J5780_06710, partial [Treponema sp.]|nr:hypothetical protein [Treponema sp.]
IGRFVLAGRLLAPLSLFFITVFTDQNQRQDFTHNVFIALLLSIFTGLLMPLDASNTTSTCTVAWNFEGLFLMIRITLFISTVICFIYKALTKNSKETFKSLKGFILLSAGYNLLCTADCFFILGTGLLLLVTGTYFFILSYHETYLWR